MRLDVNRVPAPKWKNQRIAISGSLPSTFAGIYVVPSDHGSEAGTLLCLDVNQRYRPLVHFSPWRRLSRPLECREPHGAI